ncbi:MAG: hypothetical protein M1813_005151 [Trichoglossum hirsutum]|nr:MAG: hypothetical protein M1813_005151 [Trichoglossum hirsutum]
MTEKISDPEWMTPYQEGVFNRRFDVGTADEDKWRATYIYLFPDDPNGPCMNPCEFTSVGDPSKVLVLISLLDYNYTSLTHRLPPSALSHTPQKRCKSLSSEPDQNLHNKRRAPEVSTTTPQTGSSITQSRNLQRYSQLPPEHRTPRDPGYPEIGISRYTDNISWSTFHDSDYGSIDSGIPSSAGPSVPMASSSGHPDHASVGSGIPPSGDPSVLMAPSPGYLPLTKGFPDFSSPTTLEYSDPASPDPVLPSSVLPPDELFETPDMALWP